MKKKRELLYKLLKEPKTYEDCFNAAKKREAGESISFLKEVTQFNDVIEESAKKIHEQIKQLQRVFSVESPIKEMDVDTSTICIGMFSNIFEMLSTTVIKHMYQKLDKIRQDIPDDNCLGTNSPPNVTLSDEQLKKEKLKQIISSQKQRKKLLSVARKSGVHTICALLCDIQDFDMQINVHVDKIWNQYIVDGSPMQVNIIHTSLDGLTLVINQREFKHGMFDEAKREIERLILTDVLFDYLHDLEAVERALHIENEAEEIQIPPQNTNQNRPPSNSLTASYPKLTRSKSSEVVVPYIESAKWGTNTVVPSKLKKILGKKDIEKDLTGSSPDLYGRPAAPSVSAVEALKVELPQVAVEPDKTQPAKVKKYPKGADSTDDVVRRKRSSRSYSKKQEFNVDFHDILDNHKTLLSQRLAEQNKKVIHLVIEERDKNQRLFDELIRSIEAEKQAQLESYNNLLHLLRKEFEVSHGLVSTEFDNMRKSTPKNRPFLNPAIVSNPTQQPPVVQPLPLPTSNVPNPSPIRSFPSSPLNTSADVAKSELESSGDLKLETKPSDD
eukprot:TRINITY_DN27681_c0_g1_i1.p1 TRINITY_DN27681_c0_g1~~TRINITY_DN27681_c0_g1_i1.p1  ORF type:complete len:556 (+),score=154.19 TRINITY_DN27681_c0_g1_i1:62-1729(+)